MTQTFQREKIDGEKKKVKIKDVWSKGKQQKILFFFVSQHFFLDFLNVWFFNLGAD